MIKKNPRVLCLLFEGFEEIEALTPVDILRRVGSEVVLVATGESLQVRGRSGIVVVAEELLEPGIGTGDCDLLLLPGGPGVAALRESDGVSSLIKKFASAQKGIAAICAAPLLLKDAGLLPGRPHTAHFSAHTELDTPQPAARVVRDGTLITSRGAGTALDFSLEIVRFLYGDKGEENANQVAEAIMA